MSKATVVTTLPFQIVENKYGLIPFQYIIPKAEKDDIASLVIEDGYHLFLIPLSDDKAPPMKVTDLSDTIANGLIQDYTNSCLGVSYDPLENGAVPIPGMFWVQGEKYDSQIKKEFPQKVAQAKKNTVAWFERLIKLADDDWAKTHQLKTISDLQRNACNHLGLKREWNFSAFDQKISLCWACKSSVNPLAIICNSCQAILNKEEFEKNRANFVTSVVK